MLASDKLPVAASADGNEAVAHVLDAQQRPLVNGRSNQLLLQPLPVYPATQLRRHLKVLTGEAEVERWYGDEA